MIDEEQMVGKWLSGYFLESHCMMLFIIITGVAGWNV